MQKIIIIFNAMLIRWKYSWIFTYANLSITPIASSSSFFSRATQFFSEIFYVIKTWNVISLQFSHPSPTHGRRSWWLRGRNVTLMEAVAATAEKEEKKLFFQFNKTSAIVMVDGMNLTWISGDTRLNILDVMDILCSWAVFEEFGKILILNFQFLVAFWC